MFRRRQDAWEDDYRMRRYLANASDAAVAQRFRDLLFNYHNVTAEGRLGIVNDRGERLKWLALLTHILQEFNMRGGIPEDATSRDDLPFITFPKVPKGFQILKGATLPDRTLIKLGKSEHMREMFFEGRIRISAASSYADPSLNHAINDDELSIFTLALRDETTVRILDKKTGKPGPIIPLLDDVMVTESVYDFYVYCMSDKYDYRLVDDFEASAMVVVHDCGTFSRKLSRAIREQLGDDYTYMWIPVYYVDPYNFDHTRLSGHFSKHFRFSYQHEHRFLMVPKDNRTEPLPPFFVNIGSLTDVATLYILE